MNTITTILGILPAPFVPQWFHLEYPGASTGTWETLDTLAHRRQLKTPKPVLQTLEDAIGAIDSIRGPLNEANNTTRFRVIQDNAVVWSSHRPRDL